MSTISKTSTFEVPKFSQIFSPLPFRWVLPAGFGPSGRGSRGETPLHYAAAKGRVSAVARLIEAKAAVDAKANRGRGLGTRDFGGGKPSWGNGIFTWGSGWKVDSIQVFSWFVFSLFMESVSQNVCATILFCSLVVTIFHDCVLCPPWVAFFVVRL